MSDSGNTFSVFFVSKHANPIKPAVSLPIAIMVTVQPFLLYCSSMSDTTLDTSIHCFNFLLQINPPQCGVFHPCYPPEPTLP